MPIKGVTFEEEKVILSILEPYKNKYDFYYYGSRVKGNFRPLSDLDILLISKNDITINDIYTLKEAFDESILPYVVNISYNIDVKFYNLIKNGLVKI